MPSWLPFYISNGYLMASGFATLTKGRRGIEEEMGEGEIEEEPSELLMHEELSRFLSINFSNYSN